MLTADERIEVIRSYKDPYPYFVETGTADGYTTKSLVGDFERLVTVELDYPRYLHVSVTEFLGTPNVMPLYGDSAVVMEQVVYWLDRPTLFWLDAHYSGGARGSVDTPIVDELDLIRRHCKVPHAVLVDDARLFGTDPSYPTWDWVAGFAEAQRFVVVMEDDIIRMTPREDK